MLFRPAYFILIFIFSISSYGFYLEYFHEIIPCSLCWIQRICYWASATILIGYLIAYAYSYLIFSYSLLVFSLIFLILGEIVSSWQIYLQLFSSIDTSLDSCLPSIFEGWQWFSLKEFIELYFLSSSNCSEVKFLMFGLSLPVWSALAFALCIIALVFECFFIYRR